MRKEPSTIRLQCVWIVRRCACSTDQPPRGGTERGWRSRPFRRRKHATARSAHSESERSRTPGAFAVVTTSSSPARTNTRDRTPSPADFCSRAISPSAHGSQTRSHGMRDRRSRTIRTVRGTYGSALRSLRCRSLIHWKTQRVFQAVRSHSSRRPHATSSTVLTDVQTVDSTRLRRKSGRTGVTRSPPVRTVLAGESVSCSTEPSFPWPRGVATH